MNINIATTNIVSVSLGTELLKAKKDNIIPTPTMNKEEIMLKQINTNRNHPATKIKFRTEVNIHLPYFLNPSKISITLACLFLVRFKKNEVTP